MKRKNLIGSRVALVVSDPWEFGTQCGTGPFLGFIKDKENGKVLILLDSPIFYSEDNYSVCICSPRHKGKDINDTIEGEKIAANMMLISATAASFSDIKRQSQFKTQAIIGTIEQV